MKFPLASPDIRDSDIQRVVDVLHSGMLVQGERVAELERDVADYLGAPTVLAASNGTATLHLALVALGVGPGDEVIVPAFSYIATANVVELVGATPVFVEIDLATFNIDVSRIEAAITGCTRAIIPVHEFGLACEIRALMEIADRHGIPVIEDAACALGTKDGDGFAGTFGTFGSFSLHPRKAITSGEGGLLACKDAVLAERVSILRNHGIKMIDGQMSFEEAGFNYRLTEMQATLASGQFERREQTLAKKQKLAEIYLSELDVSAVALPHVPPDKVHTWQTFHLLVAEGRDRDALIRELRAADVGTNYGAQCLPAQAYFQKKYGHDCATEFPAAMAAWQRGLALPLYEKLTEQDVQTVTDTFNTIVKNS
jgi:perosamine synthetase